MSVHTVRPARPGQVMVAFWLQIAAALLLLVLIGTVVAYAVYFNGEISRAIELVPDADPAEVRAERSSNVFMALIVGVPALLLVALLAATAVPVRRGSKAGRILVFVAAGGQLLLCTLQTCGGFLFTPLFYLGVGEEVPGEGEAAPDGVPWDERPWEDSEFAEALYSDPDPFFEILFPAAGGDAFLVFVIMAAVVLLLTLPPANRYFVPRADPPAAGWPIHPVGYALPTGYPAPPGYPTPVGYPPVVQYPMPVPYPVCPDPASHAPAAAPPTDTPAAAPTDTQTTAPPTDTPAAASQPQAPAEAPAGEPPSAAPSAAPSAPTDPTPGDTPPRPNSDQA